MRRIHGLPAAPGVVLGPWVRIERSVVPTGSQIEASGADAELGRLAVATATASEELESIARAVAADGHADEAAIFAAQASIASDPALAAMAKGRIVDASDDAIAAILSAAGAFAEQLRSLDDELLAARAADVLDVGERIARRLAGVADESAASLARPTIVVADDLAPSVTATLPRERLLGIALTGSSPTAHAAILARAYGIPAVVGAAALLDVLDAERASGRGHELALDGTTGELVIDPDEEARTRIEARAAERLRALEADRHEAALPAVTRDGVEIELHANIGTPDEADDALALGARGVGLFRTEFLFLERTSAPSEDEQVAAYERAVRAFAPQPVTLRLLDVGGDKPIPYLPIAHEANPFLGVRALRLAYVDPRPFVTQLRASYRAARAGSLKVMAPMVAEARDVELLLDLAGRARTELAADGIEAGRIELGVMLEIPSAILVADSFFGRISFASLGTNDLLQYTLAADRGNAELERYRDSLHPGVLRLVRLAVEAAERAGIELSVCGEMAGDPSAALALAGLGIRSLSMAASSLPAVRRSLRDATLAELRTAAEASLADASATDSRARFDRLRTTPESPK